MAKPTKEETSNKIKAHIQSKVDNYNKPLVRRGSYNAVNEVNIEGYKSEPTKFGGF